MTSRASAVRLNVQCPNAFGTDRNITGVIVHDSECIQQEETEIRQPLGMAQIPDGIWIGYSTGDDPDHHAFGFEQPDFACSAGANLHRGGPLAEARFDDRMG